jgi:hypothetical protein
MLGERITMAEIFCLILAFGGVSLLILMNEQNESSVVSSEHET